MEYWNLRRSRSIDQPFTIGYIYARSQELPLPRDAPSHDSVPTALLPSAVYQNNWHCKGGQLQRLSVLKSI